MENPVLQKIYRISRGLSGKAYRWLYADSVHGISVFSDVRQQLPKFSAATVFDVGAHMGESSLRFLSAFPNARVYCFEPAVETHKRLCRRLERSNRVQCFRFALGATCGHGLVANDVRSTRRSLVREDDNSLKQVDSSDRVEIQTLTAVCERLEIDHIGYLKIDTEGHDLEVLRGGERLLSEQRIDLVQVEVGMNPRNQLHVPFEDLKSHLEERSYNLFGIYEQVLEWPTDEPILRRCDALFISERTAAMNTRSSTT